MGVDLWCFCNGGGGKSERLKAAIFTTKSAAMAKLSDVSGTGFLIHRSLFLTSHVNLPSVNVAESTEIRLQNGVPATLVPHRFFITSSVLDLTIVGLDIIEGDSVSPGGGGHQPQYLKLCSKPNIELGNTIYLLGHSEKKELSIGEGKVVIATDNLIKFSTEGFTWRSGSAGLDSQGNLAFMICDPMKLATPLYTKSSPTSSSPSTTWKKDHPMQFGIPLPVIFDWLNQHWEGSLDELSKPKLPLMRLVSAGHRSEHSCASFSMRRVFKEAEEETEGPTSSSNTVLKPREQLARTSEDEKLISLPHHDGQGIPTPEIYESSKVTSNPIKVTKKETIQIPLLDINFPPRMSKLPATPTRRIHFSEDLIPGSGENRVNESPSRSLLKEEKPGNMASSSKEEIKRVENREDAINDGNEECGSMGSVDDDRHSRVCSSSQVALSEEREGHSSEGETLYSAETAESRNYKSPREGRFQPVGRSQSCVSYNKWGLVHRNPVARKSPIALEKQRSFMNPRKTYSQGTPSHKTIDYFSPTVSSIMKKRNDMEQSSRLRPTAVVHSSGRWNF